jgi:hypothetical protein
MSARFILRNMIYFRDFFYLKLRNRYPAYTDELLKKESVNALLMALSGYYATLLGLLLIIGYKFNLLVKVNQDNELILRVIVPIVFLGPIFLLRYYFIIKFRDIPFEEHFVSTHQKDMKKRLISVCAFGYLSIYIFPTLLNHFLSLV